MSKMTMNTESVVQIMIIINSVQPATDLIRKVVFATRTIHLLSVIEELTCFAAMGR